MNTEFLSQLAISALIKIKESSWNGKNFIELEKMLTTDTAIINYRLDALSDLMENDTLFESIKEILPQLLALSETRAVNSGENDDIDNFFAVRDLQFYVNIIDFLNERLQGAKISSKLFCELRDGIAEVALDESFEKIKAAIPENNMLITQMQSVTIGINLDGSMHPCEAGIVSINNRRFSSGNIVDKVLRLDLTDNPYQCSSPLTRPSTLLVSREERQAFEIALNNALSRLMRSSIRSFKPAVKAYTYAKTSFLLGYYNDLRFLCAAAEFFRKLKALGYSVCRPVVHEMSERKCDIKGLYFPQLVIDGVHMTENDFCCDDKGAMFLMSGANSGGKTIFAKSVAVCQSLFQLGLFVPASSAHLSPASEILLHFSSAGKSIAQSRFTEECQKMSNLMALCDEYSMVVCDEPFSGTSAYEAKAISEEVLKAMSAKGVRGVFISHIHELSELPQTVNEEDFVKSPLDNLTVQISSSDSKRLYKVLREKTSGSSFAKDIADKYGLSFEKLMSQK